MLKTSSTKSAEPRKSVVGVGGGGRNRAETVGKHEVDGNKGGGCSGDSDRKCSLDAPKLMCPPTPLTSMLRTSLSTDSLASAAQIVVEFDGVDAGGGGTIGKSVKNLSKSRRIIKKSKKPQRPEKLQRSSVWRNVYRSTDPPSKNSSFR